MGDKQGQLSLSELRLLRALSSLERGELDLDSSEAKIGLPKSTVSSLARLLESKGLVRIIAENVEELSLTDKGRDALANGLPEERLVEALLRSGGVAPAESLKEELGQAFSVALGLGIKANAVKVESGQVRLLSYEGLREDAQRLRGALAAVSEGGRPDPDTLRVLVSRGLVKASRRKAVKVVLTEEGLRAVRESTPTISRLTHEVLVRGDWRQAQVRPYDVSVEPPRILPARKHPLAEFIEELKDVMVELGFVEVEGPLVELELFNFDALFQPQDHPAREIQDTLWPDLPPADLTPYADLVKVVKDVHEGGWGYVWSQDVAARLILRSQTTSVSIRVLSQRPKPPIRFFTVDKVFRADPVDATHLSDFHQLDGIMGWHGYSFRDLLGFLTQFSRKLGLEVRFKPAYFPFTEPSVEGYAKIGGSLVEVFGAGLFRPEVLRIAGVDYQVGAWGMGVERLALAKYGLSDVRDLYSKDYEFLSSFRARV